MCLKGYAMIFVKECPKCSSKNLWKSGITASTARVIIHRCCLDCGEAWDD